MAEQGESSPKNKITPQDVKKMAHKMADFFEKDKNPEVDQKRYEERFENWAEYLGTLDKMESERVLSREEKNFIIINLIVKNEFDAEHDFLTGVYNRDGFERRSHELLNESKRRKTPLTLIGIDIDNFKGLNDQEGHKKGDSFLILFSQIFKANIRMEDLIARFGGDEFVILLDQDKTKGQEILNRFQSQIQRLIDLDFSDLKKPLSFSYGIFEISNEQKENINTLINFVDGKMYEMKEAKKEANG